MENVSVSKGSFPYHGSYKIGQRKEEIPLNMYEDELWYVAYKQISDQIEKATKNAKFEMSCKLMKELFSYVSNIKYTPVCNIQDEITTAILLTGVNIPDHEGLFQTIVDELLDVTPNIAITWSRNISNLTSFTEDVLHQLMNDSGMDGVPEIRKNQCSFFKFKLWHKKYYNKNDPVVIIIPDFESFPAKILHDFILILSSYTTTIKFVLIFGVATTLHSVHRTLSYEVTCKLRTQIFQTQPQIKALTDILESTVLSLKIPFRLTGRAFQLLSDIFLFNDFSVDTFLKNYKLCVMMHFYNNYSASLCCSLKNLKQRISQLREEDIQCIKAVPSIKNYLDKKNLNDTSDKNFQDILLLVLTEFHEHMECLMIGVRCLHNLSISLPNSLLGREIREVYASVVSSNLSESPEYIKSMQMLACLSKEELLSQLESILCIIKNHKSENSKLKNLQLQIIRHKSEIREASLEIIEDSSVQITDSPSTSSRIAFREGLLKRCQTISVSEFKRAQTDCINYLDKTIFSKFLINPKTLVGHEIFCFTNSSAVKRHICGSYRSALDMALKNPQTYLKCNCCELSEGSEISSTMLDINIIYKLHLHSKKLINMYDWLQAFICTLNPEDENLEQANVDPKLQARFTKAAAELEFLGFIKTSRRKTDHVKRLTS